MPYQLDQEALDSPNMKVLDINKPPVKNMAHQEYPRMVYLHPKDKTKEHRVNVVYTPEELQKALAKGYRTMQHIPEVKPEDLSKDFDVFEPEPDMTVEGTPHRGPGRPPKIAA